MVSFTVMKCKDCIARYFCFCGFYFYDIARIKGKYSFFLLFSESPLILTFLNICLQMTELDYTLLATDANPDGTY
jgi:hypothetical protein